MTVTERVAYLKGLFEGLEIDTEKKYPVSIEMINKNSSRNKITVSSYKEKMKHPKEIFVFNKNLYPQTEIIDLR